MIPMWYGNVIPDGMGMSYQMEWECHTRWNGNVIPMWYGNVIPDGMGMSYQVEWKCHTYVVWECHTRWNGNVIPMWYGNVLPDGMGIPYHPGMGNHTTLEWECHTRWNGKPYHIAMGMSYHFGIIPDISFYTIPKYHTNTSKVFGIRYYPRYPPSYHY